MFDFSKIRTIDDFPSPGIKFYDITTLLNDREAYHEAINDLLEVARSVRPDVVVALETRGFFFGPTLAYLLGVPFVPIRKKGKLPAATFSENYNLEYGTDSIEIHQDAFAPNQRVLLIDDVLATGGTMSAAVRLVQKFNPASIDTLFLIELKFLEGRKKLDNVTLHSLIQL
jgi:adenine phosphoribosyltransferase